MSFSRKRIPLIHPYSLNGSPLERVFGVKDLGFYLTPTLSFDNHINKTIDRSLKVLGFMKRNTRLFTSISFQNIDKTIGTMIIDVIGICNHCIISYLRILMSWFIVNSERDGQLLVVDNCKHWIDKKKPINKDWPHSTKNYSQPHNMKTKYSKLEERLLFVKER